ncbi:uncharacterized protein GGS22DRAFT_75157 [Annulohypoxylon maeteangense]|uniref:uncharacterized protein n=1 Tax=Annulohypoxylon maeteangense TaxID=1927788 RepID=UPI002007C4F3|nr:uncharacterized protein GGS22DRAFT_75157 [Annulohypoxylon maeteangense]KAI0881060.1 hypothetical protein GGS22DRAFT_75157 [Annulohypoxylon maeteangense]
MAGRRRRAPSNSTVATIDEAAIQYYQEETVLKTASSRAHPDDWPCFLLTDATIYHRNGTLANLLHVDLEGPLIVRGRLEIEKDQERFLVDRHIKGKSPRIQIQNTLSFSIGLKEDGLPMPVLWASGGAGWYEIVPSEAYKAMCDVMFQGISLHYAILDEYEATLEELHKKKKNRHKTLSDVTLSLDDVLFKYAVTVGDGITLPEAHKRTRDQAIFLLSHFPKDTEFHNWLSHEFPTIVKRMAKKESNDPKTSGKAGTSPLIAVPYPPLEKSSSLEAVEIKKKGRPPLPLRNSASRSLRHSGAPSSDAHDLSSDEQIQANLPKAKHKSPRKTRSESTRGVDMMILDVPDDQQRGLNAASHLERSFSQDASRPNLATTSSLSIVVEALQDIRQEMLELLDEGKQKKHPDDMSPKGWCTKLYLELSIRNPKALAEVCEYFSRDLVQHLGPEWHKSQFYEWMKDSVDTKPNFEFIAENDIPNIARRKKKGKASREETQSISGTRELPVRTGGKHPPRRGRPSGKTAGLRPPTGSKKRLRHETSNDDEMDIDEDGVLRKTSKRYRYFDDDEQDEDVNDTTSSVDDDDDDDDEAENTDAPLTRLVIRAEKLPSTFPKGPNQTWTCEEPDCGYVVRAADGEDGHALIHQHYEAHEKEARDEAEQNKASLMELAVQESQKGHIPINHLLEKIRGMGEKAQKHDETQLNGQAVPQPIKRGLLI